MQASMVTATISTISTDTFLSDITIQLKKDLNENIDDPIYSSRPKDSSFVMTSYPRRAAVYPLITIINKDMNVPRRLGFGSQTHFAELTFEIRIWARNQIEKDTLFQNVTNRLRQIQNITGGTINAGLCHFQITNSLNVDEEGDSGIKSKILTVSYKYLIGA